MMTWWRQCIVKREALGTNGRADNDGLKKYALKNT